MRFEDFARSHGLIIRNLIPDRWVATPTEDHPRSSNGRYKYLGDVGWVQNWATMEKPSMWRAEGTNSLQPRTRMILDKSFDERDRLAESAAKKAQGMVASAEYGIHPYLASKGFANEKMPLWIDENWETKLLIPMYSNRQIVGCQIINEQGEKKFIYGQRSKGATFCLDAKGVPIFCEGFATALSIQSAMRANKLPYSIYVCFSASNMKDVAKRFRSGFVIADNDPNNTGERSAIETGKPYWMSDTVGEDFNDYHLRVGLFKASQALMNLLRKKDSSS